MSDSEDSEIIAIVNDNLKEKKIKKKEEYKAVFGIDLGTTNSCIALWKNSSFQIIPDEHGNKTLPSVVGFTNVTKYIGHDAKNQKDINSQNVYYEVKRLIGRKFSENRTQLEKKLLSYEIRGDEKGNIRISIYFKKCPKIISRTHFFIHIKKIKKNGRNIHWRNSKRCSNNCTCKF